MRKGLVVENNKIGNIFKKSLAMVIIVTFIGASFTFTQNIFVKTVQADLTSGLAGFWNFNEGTGSILHDVSGHGNNGTIYGAQWTPGISGYGLYFNGSNDYVEIPDNSNINFNQNDDYSYIFWFKTSASVGGGFTQIISKRTLELSTSIFVQIYEDKIGVDTGTWPNDFLIRTPSEVNDDEWHHLAMSHTGSNSTFTVYYDGVNIGTAGPETINTSNTGNLYLGRDIPENRYYNGFIDELKIYNKALTQQEIQTDMAAVGGENVPPIAIFTWTPITPTVNQTVTFDASTSTDTDGSIAKYEWDWNNDGTYENSYTTDTSTHAFTQPGTYLVTLRVTDNGGAINTKTLSVSVTSGSGTTNKGTPGFELVFTIGAIVVAMLFWKKKRIT